MAFSGKFAGLGSRVEWHENLGSTNDRALEIVLKHGRDSEGWIIGAESQTAGRGRKGAQWECEPGKGLAFSLVLCPRWERRYWGWLSLGAALAVCSGGPEALGLAPSIKWPNDVLLEGRKVCGILIETRGSCAVVGIGLNVNESALSPELEAVSLCQLLGREVDREQLVGRIREKLVELLELDPQVIAERVWERLAWKDKVVVTASGRRGRIRGFGENGELKVETPGELLTLCDPEGVRLAERQD
ncbi:MAG: biotin--[acetyl-CoA-carboxylase] ligase [Roseibacillus sp.]|nr:biotin--[acetyl-CoA-carboxylase] ligase [Roseibacillus sp.]|tara:strand:+ start:1509 stop:2243 length:735 start_codon:yes stop_codon:yes gene_type:complete